MDIITFKRTLTAFADAPADVDVRLGKVVAQIRDELIDASINFDGGNDNQLRITENGQQYSARAWITNRVARLPQLADRILASTAQTADQSARSPFVVPSGMLSPDLSVGADIVDELVVPNAVEVLLDKASSPTPGATSVIYLTSDAGEGKTTIIAQAARTQAQRFKEKQVTSLIVPVPLNGRSFLTFDDAVIAAMVNKLRFNYLYFDAFIQLVKMGVVVPAFDGYEEMLVEGSKGEAISALGNLVQSLDSAGTIVVAAREAFFEYLSFKTQAKLLDAIGDRSASFSRLALSRWSKEQFCKYGERRLVDSPESIHAVVAARLKADHPMLTRAVLVKRLFDVIEDGADGAELARLLGSNPQDYFYTFVDAIVKREASEKWLSRVSGDLMVPLISVGEHHQLLSQIAQEMWQSSTSSLRHDVLDLIVDIFCGQSKKNAATVRQIKERIKQHSLLASDSSRGNAVAFDHEDFQNFYLGEALGSLLAAGSQSQLHAFLSVNLIPTSTIEQAIQYLIRQGADKDTAWNNIVAITASEAGFTFCKENCSGLALRLVECFVSGNEVQQLNGMFFSQGSLASRSISNVLFLKCQFQPTSLVESVFDKVEFRDCEFERLELASGLELQGSAFIHCKVDSLVLSHEEDQIFSPALIQKGLRATGARVEDAELPQPTAIQNDDERAKIFSRFLRVFLRSTYVDEEIIRLRLGKGFAATFFDSILPELLASKILEEVPWRGQGNQHRYKLVSSMASIESALEQSLGRFDSFISLMRPR